MSFVVDASVVGSWMLPDEDHPEAVTALEKLKDDEAFAPSLLWFELRNLLLANERRQRITPTQTAAALNLFQELPLRFDSQPDSNTTLQLAREHRLSVYDAVYLELAPAASSIADLRRRACRSGQTHERRQSIVLTIIFYYCNPSGHLINPSANVQPADIYPVAGLFAAVAGPHFDAG